MSFPDGALHLLVDKVGPAVVGLDAEERARGVGVIQVPQDAVQPVGVGPVDLEGVVHVAVVLAPLLHPEAAQD